MTQRFRAVIFDLGGVVFPSPFEAFDAFDTTAGLPSGSVRGLIRTSSETGAWAALERSELSLEEFFEALEAEAEANGFILDARALLASIGNGFGARPEMVLAIERIRAQGLKVAALTNNWSSGNWEPADGAASPNGRRALAFDVVVESSVERLRKPDPEIYHLVLERLAVPAEESVFLDDLGINLKPARAMGMTTIKVTNADDALGELEQVLGFAVR
jgi:putative hydrolase of the HAD superfamily